MFFSFNHVDISGVASAVPSSVEQVESYILKFGSERIRKFSESTGIRERHIGAPTKTLASDTCYAAAKHLLESQQLLPEAIDGLVFLSNQRDYDAPTTASVLQARLGIGENAVCIDVPQGCTAYIVGLYICGMMVESGLNSVLLLAGAGGRAENTSSLEIPMLFGDAGSATLLSRRETAGRFCGGIRTMGKDYKMQIIPFGQFRHPVEEMIRDIGTIETQKRTGKFYMNGMDTLRFTMGSASQMILDTLHHFDFTIDSFDLVVLHQANQIITSSVARKIKADYEKVPITIDRFANTGAASIPLTLCDAYGKNNSNEPSQILMSGFGIGLMTGVAQTMINPKSVLPIIETNATYEDGINYESYQ